MKLKTENYEKFSMRAVALIGLLISFSIVAIFFYDTGRLENEPYGHTKHYTAHTDKQITRICSFADTKVAAIECAIDQKTTKRDAKRAEQDLNAQQKMAAWAWWMTIVTGATAIVAGFGVFFVWNDTRETRKIGQIQTRAYVNIDHTNILQPPDIFGFKAKLVFKNSGHTPAHKVKIRCRVRTIDSTDLSSFERSLDNSESTEPITVAPNGAFAKGIDTILKPEEKILLDTEVCIVVIFGDVRYVDVYHGSQVSQFCLRVWHFGSDEQRIVPMDFGNEST